MDYGGDDPPRTTEIVHELELRRSQTASTKQPRQRAGRFTMTSVDYVVGRLDGLDDPPPAQKLRQHLRDAVAQAHDAKTAGGGRTHRQGTLGPQTGGRRAAGERQPGQGRVAHAAVPRRRAAGRRGEVDRPELHVDPQARCTTPLPGAYGNQHEVPITDLYTCWRRTNHPAQHPQERREPYAGHIRTSRGRRDDGNW